MSHPPPPPPDAARVTGLILEFTCWPPEMSALAVATASGAKLVVGMPGALARVLWVLGAARRRHEEIQLEHLAGWVRVKELPQLLVESFGESYRMQIATATKYLRRIARRYRLAAGGGRPGHTAAPPILEHDHAYGVRLVCALRHLGPTA